VSYCPRRTVLDKLRVDAASESGAEIREGFTLEDLLVDDGSVVGIRGHSKDGDPVTEHAKVVIGADGRYSHVAKAVGAHQYNEKPQILCGYFSYWSNLPIDGRFEVYIRRAIPALRHGTRRHPIQHRPSVCASSTTYHRDAGTTARSA
jgi:flavin-dependent dehydrogenase